jgi:hypothetical protein
VNDGVEYMGATVVFPPAGSAVIDGDGTSWVAEVSPAVVTVAEVAGARLVPVAPLGAK